MTHLNRRYKMHLCLQTTQPLQVEWIQEKPLTFASMPSQKWLFGSCALVCIVFAIVIEMISFKSENSEVLPEVLTLDLATPPAPKQAIALSPQAQPTPQFVKANPFVPPLEQNQELLIPEPQVVSNSEVSSEPIVENTVAVAQEKIIQTPQVLELEREPALLKGDAPEYPKRALDRGLEGEVIVLIEINEMGQVKSAQIEKSPSQIFNKPVLESVYKAIYQSPVRKGQAHGARFRQSFQFYLE